MTHALHIPADRGNVRTESIRALKHENALLDRVSWRAVTSACKPVAVLHWEMQQHGNEEDEIFLKCEDEGNADTDILVRHQAYTQCVLMGVWQNWIFSMWGILLCWGALQGADPAAGSSEGSSPECCLSFSPPPPTEPEHSTNLPCHTSNDACLPRFGSLSRLSRSGRLFSASNYGLRSSDGRQRDTPMSKYINSGFLTLGCLCYFRLI